ncbi:MULTISPECIES: tripartite tricarboxylate transporter TctB family protein [Neorhizobium]|uniref:tripartite tricarboxylate transporter TctB family protein n=1 Tax=Neorhizobium TaxID=1525371 RepID=UPI000CF980A4|nr:MULTISPECIES: tripartite tricarboxylate transporter TctB family protein [Neorhizobium]
MKLSERLIGPGLILFGGGVIIASADLPQVPGVRFGADLMPSITGGALILFGGLLGWKAWSKPLTEPLVDTSEWEVSLRKRLTAIWTIGALLAATLLFQSVGFPLIGLIFMTVLMVLMGARPLTIAIVAPLFVLALHLSFTRIMHVELPAGPLGAFL